MKKHLLSRGRSGSLALLSLLAGLWADSAVGAVNDVLPWDYYALPPGSSNVALYYLDRYQEGPFLHNANVANLSIRSHIGAVRLVHNFEVGGYTVAGMVVAPYAKASISGNPYANTSASGACDAKIGGTVWLVNEPDVRRFVAVTASVNAPTGSYDKTKAVNIGENRWRYVLALGWIEPLADKLSLDVVPEVAWYGDNTEYLGSMRLEQATTYSLTSYLKYNVVQGTYLNLGVQFNDGGKTKVNGVEQDNPSQGRRWSAGVTQHFDSDTQLTVRYLRDVSQPNGLRTSGEWTVRLLRRF